MTDEKIMATVKPDGECWQPELEKMPRKQLEELQVKKLKDTINVCLQSPFYKKRLGELGITADSINSLEMTPCVFTLLVVLRVTLVSLSILSTISARGLT